jgi:hypothetical protein
MRGIRRPEVERSMGAVAVVVLDEDAEHALELAPVEDEEPSRDTRSGRCERSARRSHSPWENGSVS